MTNTPNPANSAQGVTGFDALELDIIRHGDMLGSNLGARVYAALAAIGAGGQAVQDTWFTDRALPIKAMSGDVEDNRVLRLHFRRPVTDDDRKAMCDALNLHQASLAHPSPAIPVKEVERVLEDVMNQTETDLKSAHEEICKLQGLDPSKHTWPEWSSPANTLRWFEKIRSRLRAGPQEAGDECMWTDKPCTCGGGPCEQVDFGAAAPSPEAKGGDRG